MDVWVMYLIEDEEKGRWEGRWVRERERRREREDGRWVREREGEGGKRGWKVGEGERERRREREDGRWKVGEGERRERERERGAKKTNNIITQRSRPHIQ